MPKENDVEFTSITGETIDFVRDKKKKQSAKNKKSDPAPPPDPPPDSKSEQIQQLSLLLENLTRCVSEMAHYSGAAKVLKKYGIQEYELQDRDMRRYK